MAENEKQTNKERLKDITDSIERGIQDLFQSDKYTEYLRTMKPLSQVQRKQHHAHLYAETRRHFGGRLQQVERPV